MKKFSFSMQGLLNARAAQKAAIEHELSRARQKLAAETQVLEKITGEIAARLSAPLPAAAPTAYDFLQRDKYIASLKRKRREQQIKVNAADAAVKVCLSQLRLADIELKKVEKLEEREHTLWETDASREEQKINDEIGTARNFYKARPA